MVGVSIKLAGVIFDDPIASSRLPSLEGLVAEFVLGGTKAASIVNMANRNTPATTTGAPVYGAGFVTTVQNTDFINLNVPVPAQDLTMIMVSRAGAGTLAALGNHQFLGATYTGFERIAADGNYFWNTTGNRNGQAKLPNPASQGFVFQCGLAPLGGLAKLVIGANRVLSTDVAEVAGQSPRSALPNFTISGQAISQGGDTAYVAIYDRLLTDDEVTAAYASVSAFLAGRGVVVS